MYFKAGEIEYKDQSRFYFVIGLDPDEMDFLLETFTVEFIVKLHVKFVSRLSVTVQLKFM